MWVSELSYWRCNDLGAWTILWDYVFLHFLLSIQIIMLCLRCRHCLPIDQNYFYRTWTWFYNFPLKTSQFPMHTEPFKLYCNLSPTKYILIQLYQEKNMRVKISTMSHTRSMPRVLSSALDNVLPTHHQDIAVWTTPKWKKRKNCPGGSGGRESACNAGDPGSVPGSGRSPGEGNGHPF